MFDYLEKFENLPKELRSAVSSAQAVRVVSELEEKHGIGLDIIVIKLMVKEASWPGLVNYLIREENLTQEQGEKLQADLESKLFISAKIKKYLGIENEAPAPPEKGRVRPVDKIDASAAGVEHTPAQYEIRDETKDLEDLGIKEVIKSAVEDIRNVDEFFNEVWPEVLKLSNLPSADETSIQRLQNIVKIFLKGIRDGLDSKEAMMKNKESGGLGLSFEQAEKIIEFLKQKIKSKHISFKAQKKTDKSVLPMPGLLEQIRDVDYSFPSPPSPLPPASPELQRGKREEGSIDKKEKVKSEFSKEELEHELAPPPPVVKARQAPPPPALRTASPPPKIIEFQEKIAEPKPTEQKPAAANVKKPAEQIQIKRPAAAPVKSDKKRMDDIVKPVSRMQGPIEELANLDLVNFKRLGEDPHEGIKKIKEKIDLLEEESFTKRYQGINAWRTSPIYRMYVVLGHQSIRENRAVKQIIEEKIQAGEQVLTNEQFNAILELNKNLRV